MKQFKNKQTITDRNGAAIAGYLRDITRFPLISMDEEVRLAHQIHAGGKDADKARKRLVESNLRFVVSVANQYHQKSMELADLVSEGNIGLLKAAERFDDTRGFKFISYAVWWIRQSIMSAIAEHGNMIRLPLNQQALLQQYACLSKETMQTEHREPTLEEFAEFADITVERAKKLLSCCRSTVSGDTPIGEESDSCILDFCASENQTDEAINKESLHKDIIDAMNGVLNEKECEILKRTYGINCREESTDEIAFELGLSRERVRQIRERSLEKLRSSKAKHLLSRYLCA